MGQLGGFAYHRLVKRPKGLGYKFHHQGEGCHELWYPKSTTLYTTTPNHRGNMPKGTLWAILKQAGITLKEFLKKN